jgi:hypothetical protein
MVPLVFFVQMKEEWFALQTIPSLQLVPLVICSEKEIDDWRTQEGYAEMHIQISCVRILRRAM